MVLKNYICVAWLFFAIFLQGCLSRTYVHVLKPAPVTVHHEIETVALINRTLPESELANTAEGILTGEMPGQDGQGVENALNGVQQVMGKSERYNLKRATEQLKGSGSGGNFPQPLRWSKVERLCNKYGADAILALETYDSDFIVTRGEKGKEERVVEGDTIEEKVYYAEGVATVKMGFRLYDPVERSITDQYHFSDSRTWKATGKSLTDAAGHLINNKTAVKKCSYDAGTIYGSRITPRWEKVSRYYYKKPNDSEIADGAGYAEVGNWQKAAAIWEKGVGHADDKIAGRATYNLAVAYEVKGKLQKARKMAQKAYAEYDIKRARNYVGTLEERIQDRKITNWQMGKQVND